MKVTFKDVGQGDSIILEWSDADVNRIGLIDCSRKGSLHPVIEHLESGGYGEIDFVVLSHPHADHYSGFPELFSYVRNNNITIRRFIHTLHYVGTAYFKWCEIDTEDAKILVRILEEGEKLLNDGIIRKTETISENWRLDLTDEIYLKCLSPSDAESKEYQRIVRLDPEKNKKQASRAANYLSTVFKLTVGDFYYIFTSDGELFSFNRLLSENEHKNLKRKSLVVGQLPHHGAAKNHHPLFWASLTKSSSDYHAIASAGVNHKYRHPHFEVLESFHSNGYRIHCTSIVNGMTEYVEYLKQLAHTSSALDTCSSLAEEYTENRDRVFLLENGKCRLQ